MGRGLSQLSLLSSFGINGLSSHFGLALGTWVFRWAGLILGLDEWACEPYFSNPINNKIKLYIYNITGLSLIMVRLTIKPVNRELVIFPAQ